MKKLMILAMAAMLTTGAVYANTFQDGKKEQKETKRLFFTSIRSEEQAQVYRHKMHEKTRQQNGEHKKRHFCLASAGEVHLYEVLSSKA